MKKYSSFKKQQILTESFRRFMNEEEDPCLAAETEEEFEDCMAAMGRVSGNTPGLKEALTGGIDEFAKELGVPGLPHGFTDDQLVDFVNNILAASPAQEAGSDFSKIAPRTQGETNKSFQSRSHYARAEHPLTTPTIAGQPKSGVGFALEKLIMNRVATAKRNGAPADALEQARHDLIMAVSPTGDVAAKKGILSPAMAKKFNNRRWDRHNTRKKAVQGPGGAALGLQEGWGDEDIDLGDMAKGVGNAIMPGLGTAAANSFTKRFGGAKGRGSDRWDWWEEEEGMDPKPGMPQEILKLIPHWKHVMKKWKMWPCKESAAAHAKKKDGGFFGDAFNAPTANVDLKGMMGKITDPNKNCNELVHSAKLYALKLGNDHFDKWTAAKKKEAGDARSQEIGKKRAADREARKAARAAEMGVTREGIIKMKVLNLKKEKKSVLKNIIEEEVRKLKLKEADMSSDEFYDFMNQPDPRHRPRNKPRGNPQPAKPKRVDKSIGANPFGTHGRFAGRKKETEAGGADVVQAADLVTIMRDPKLHAAIARVTAREKTAIKALLDMITAMTGQGEQASQQVGLLMQKLGAAIEESGSGK